MIIIERNQQNPTKRNSYYVAKDFAWLQPLRAIFEQGIIEGEA